jgi:23S rRNA (guanine2445-N2)-methyltransferase / 23S rRNA (guanine2069-N7)-methyltransferase
MAGELDVQRDHVRLIHGALARLAAGGVLIFSTNFRKFRLDAAALAALDVRDVTAATIPKDFARDAKIHRCYEIRTGSSDARPTGRRTETLTLGSKKERA